METRERELLVVGIDFRGGEREVRGPSAAARQARGPRLGRREAERRREPEIEEREPERKKKEASDRKSKKLYPTCLY